MLALHHAVRAALEPEHTAHRNAVKRRGRTALTRRDLIEILELKDLGLGKGIPVFLGGIAPKHLLIFDQLLGQRFKRQPRLNTGRTAVDVQKAARDPERLGKDGTKDRGKRRGILEGLILRAGPLPFPEEIRCIKRRRIHINGGGLIGADARRRKARAQGLILDMIEVRQLHIRLPRRQPKLTEQNVRQDQGVLPCRHGQRAGLKGGRRGIDHHNKAAIRLHRTRGGRKHPTTPFDRDRDRGGGALTAHRKRRGMLKERMARKCSIQTKHRGFSPYF